MEIIVMILLVAGSGILPVRLLSEWFGKEHSSSERTTFLYKIGVAFWVMCTSIFIASFLNIFSSVSLYFRLIYFLGNIIVFVITLLYVNKTQRQNKIVYDVIYSSIFLIGMLSAILSLT